MTGETGMAAWKFVLIVAIMLFIVVPLLAFVAQRAISPGSGSSGTTVELQKTTETLP